MLAARHYPRYIDRIREEEQTSTAKCGYSSFFARDKVPERFRSKTIIPKDRILTLAGRAVGPQEALDFGMIEPDEVVIPGQPMRVCTIDDVVRWAQNDPDIYTDDSEFTLDEAPACDSRWGACE